MARRSFVTVTTRLRGTDHPVKLDINECRAIGRETKRLLKSGMRQNEAKVKAVSIVKGVA